MSKLRRSSRLAAKAAGLQKSTLNEESLEEENSSEEDNSSSSAFLSKTRIPRKRQRTRKPKGKSATKRKTKSKVKKKRSLSAAVSTDSRKSSASSSLKSKAKKARFSAALSKLSEIGMEEFEREKETFEVEDNVESIGGDVPTDEDGKELVAGDDEVNDLGVKKEGTDKSSVDDGENDDADNGEVAVNSAFNSGPNGKAKQRRGRQWREESVDVVANVLVLALDELPETVDRRRKQWPDELDSVFEKNYKIAFAAQGLVPHRSLSAIKSQLREAHKHKGTGRVGIQKKWQEIRANLAEVKELEAPESSASVFGAIRRQSLRKNQKGNDANSAAPKPHRSNPVASGLHAVAASMRPAVDVNAFYEWLASLEAGESHDIIQVIRNDTGKVEERLARAYHGAKSTMEKDALLRHVKMFLPS